MRPGPRGIATAVSSRTPNLLSKKDGESEGHGLQIEPLSGVEMGLQTTRPECQPYPVTKYDSLSGDC